MRTKMGDFSQAVILFCTKNMHNKEYHKKYYLEHKEKMNKYNKEWISSNRKRFNELVYSWQKNNPEYICNYIARKYYYNNKIKANATSKLNRAIKIGKITRMPCEKCGNKKSEGHHSDYEKPLDVIWLCKKCHEELHVLINKLNLN